MTGFPLLFPVVGLTAILSREHTRTEAAFSGMARPHADLMGSSCCVLPPSGAWSFCTQGQSVK